MNVHHVTAGADVFTCNAYLVTGGRTTLVDAGAMDGVVDEIREHTDHLDQVVLTHQHGDHLGQLNAVMEAFDCDCYAYAEHPLRTHELDDGDFVEIGDETFEAVYTPGHAADHLSFVSDTTLFSGDVVVHNDAAFDYGSFGRTDMAGQSRERLVESIKHLLDRMPEGVEHLYAGHGDVFHGDVRDVVETALSRAERRESKYPDEQ
ncbi:MBL fold metallo-hydrolase [Haloarchaeobius sp. DFWS5]|uniref:MBL fold metallo-hydrolase n=1 Tax=Haloarchaeobius sp. DFWS5 TaxID=3446114 RepID=UPI003EBB124F